MWIGVSPRSNPQDVLISEKLEIDLALRLIVVNETRRYRSGRRCADTLRSGRQSAHAHLKIVGTEAEQLPRQDRAAQRFDTVGSCMLLDCNAQHPLRKVNCGYHIGATVYAGGGIRRFIRRHDPLRRVQITALEVILKCDSLPSIGSEHEA